MGSNHHAPVEVDPQALHNSQKLWQFFTKATFVGIVMIAIFLLGMGVFLL